MVDIICLFGEIMKVTLIDLSKNIFCGHTKKDVKLHNKRIDKIDNIFNKLINKDIQLAKSIATDMLNDKDNRVKYIGASYSLKLGINRVKSKLTLLKIYYFEKDPSLGMVAYILLEDCKQKKKTKHK